MRYRLGRTIRFLIALAFLVFLIPFLTSKLDSGTNLSTVEDNKVDNFDVRKQLSFFSLLTSSFFEYIEQDS